MISPKLLSQLVAFRHELHQYPEVSGEEAQTAQRIVRALEPLQADHLISGVGGTGIVATFDSGQAGPHLLFRAELDALPIQELNDFAHQSTIPGVSHKCGHDGHSTVLLGLAKILHKDPLKKGKVSLLFQPAEETGAGAAAMLADAKMEEIRPDYVFAFHNLPGYPLGSILLKEGAITPAVRSMIIHFSGKTAHAAEPENGTNPIGAMARILLDLESMSIPDTEREDFRLITPVHVNLGEKAYGVAAGAGEIHLTIRAWTEAQMENMINELQALIARHTQNQRIQFNISWTDSFLGNTNDSGAIQMLAVASKENDYPLIWKEAPLRFGEDFGYFTQRYPGAFIGIGAGEGCPALHNPDYDFPDELIPIGLGLFLGIIDQALK